MATKEWNLQILMWPSSMVVATHDSLGHANTPIQKVFIGTINDI